MGNLSTARVGLHSEKRIASMTSRLSAAKALCLASIAHLLAEYQQLEAGIVPHDWMDLPVAIRERSQRLSERVTRELDPMDCESDMREAVAQIEEWMDGPYGGRGTEPTPADIAREAISRYQALRTRVTR